MQYDHHGNPIPPPRRSRDELQSLVRTNAAVSISQKRVHPREYEPLFGDLELTREEQVGFDLETIQRLDDGR